MSGEGRGGVRALRRWVRGIHSLFVQSAHRDEHEFQYSLQLEVQHILQRVVCWLSSLRSHLVLHHNHGPVGKGVGMSHDAAIITALWVNGHALCHTQLAEGGVNCVRARQDINNLKLSLTHLRVNVHEERTALWWGGVGGGVGREVWGGRCGEGGVYLSLPQN